MTGKQQFIAELLQERDELDALIAALRRHSRGGQAEAAPAKAKDRKRTFSSAARRRMSAGMRKYWKKRRAAAAVAAKAAA